MKSGSTRSKRMQSHRRSCRSPSQNRSALARIARGRFTEAAFSLSCRGARRGGGPLHQSFLLAPRPTGGLFFFVHGLPCQDQLLLTLFPRDGGPDARIVYVSCAA